MSRRSADVSRTSIVHAPNPCGSVWLEEPVTSLSEMSALSHTFHFRWARHMCLPANQDHMHQSLRDMVFSQCSSYMWEPFLTPVMHVVPSLDQAPSLHEKQRFSFGACIKWNTFFAQCALHEHQRFKSMAMRQITRADPYQLLCESLVLLEARKYKACSACTAKATACLLVPCEVHSSKGEWKDNHPWSVRMKTRN